MTPEERQQEIKDALDGIIEKPYVIANNIGYADWPDHNNPFNPEANRSAYNGYEDGFSMKQQQEDGTWWGDDE